MQMVKKLFIALFFVWLILLFFMPKQEMYYKLENALVKYDIKMNEARIEEGLFSLTLHKVDVYAKGIKLATIEKVQCFTLLFYTKMEIANLLLDDSLKSMAPTQIEKVTATHFLGLPWTVALNADGSFGGTEGQVNLKSKMLRLDFNSTKGIEMLQNQLKQDEKGWYYETSF